MGIKAVFGYIGRSVGGAIKEYLGDHQHPKTRLCHAIGTVAGVGTAAGALAAGCPPVFAFLSAFLVTYPPAIASHKKYEGNKPSTLKNPWKIPFWILGDLLMSALTIVRLDRPFMRCLGLNPDGEIIEPPQAPVEIVSEDGKTKKE